MQFNFTGTFSVIVANRSGGVGKTLATQVLRALMPPPQGVNWRPISIDSFENGQSSKLSKIMPDCVDFPIAPQLSDIKGGAFPFYQLWDDVFLNIAKGGALADFGANVAPVFSQWLEIQDGDGYGVKCAPSMLVVPVTGSAQSVGDGVATIQGFWKTQQVLPIGRTIVFLNEVFGSIENPGSAEYAWLLARAREGKLSILRMPKCEGPLLAAFDAQDVGISAGFRMSDMEFSRRFGFDNLRRLRLSQVQLADWIIAIGAEMKEVGLIDAEEKV